MLGLSGLAVLAIAATVLTAAAQIWRIVVADKAWQKKKEEANNK